MEEKLDELEENPPRYILIITKGSVRIGEDYLINLMTT